MTDAFDIMIDKQRRLGLKRERGTHVEMRTKTRTEMKRELAKVGIKFERGNLPSTDELTRLYNQHVRT